ncbi:MAG: type II toxin-antitoxin system VapC family toxin [Planctomycetaceae bacterium]
MQSVYLETTVIGNIAGRLHPDALISARQQITRRWWMTARTRYELFASELVVDECSSGDPDAAAERISELDGIALLEAASDAQSLAELLIDRNAVPASEPRDAAHIGIAAVNAIDFLATWNFKHILNPATQHLIEAVCRDAGFEPPTICTPEQLLEAYDGS